MSNPTAPNQDYGERIGRLGGITEAIGQQLREIKQDVRELRQESSKQFRWLIGLHIAGLIALGSLLLK